MSELRGFPQVFLIGRSARLRLPEPTLNGLRRRMARTPPCQGAIASGQRSRALT
jgi:hypothetical protein